MTSLESNVYVFAARYAHHRKTGAALMVAQAIIAVWHELPWPTQESIIRESHEATTNLEDWEMLRNTFIKLNE